MRLKVYCVHVDLERNVECVFLEDGDGYYGFRCPVCKREVGLKLEVDGS